MIISKKISWIDNYDGKTYIKNIYQNKYIVLADQGKEIWSDIVLELTLENIIDKYTAKYNFIEREVIKSDIVEFILELEKKGYVEKNESH